MKKLFTFGMVALALTGCSHDVEYIEPVDKVEQYGEVFKETFGEVSPNVDWGFTEMKAYVFDENGNLMTGNTRGANTEANQWVTQGLSVPRALTERQKEKVRVWFQTHPSPSGIAVNWSDFFMQQVYKGGTAPTSSCPEKYVPENKMANPSENDYVTGSDKMDWLACGNESTAWNDHANNGNAGEISINNNVVYEVDPQDPNKVTDSGSDGIMYMRDYNTQNFGFHETWGDKYHNDQYVIIPGDQIDREMAGEGYDDESVGGMYFVGFDFKSDKEGEEFTPDHYYSDWIIKVTPGLNHPNAEAKRVMVEDIIDSNLASINVSDWDFNDAVFDVRFEEAWANGKKSVTAVITLLAAGGTKPLTVGGTEVHEAFGVPTSTMVNTGNGMGTTCPPAVFRVNISGAAIADDSGSYDPNLIKVYVGEKTRIELTAQTGKATQKFCVPISTRWMKERKELRQTYDKFKSYVNKNEPLDWYKNIKNNKDERY